MPAPGTSSGPAVQTGLQYQRSLLTMLHSYLIAGAQCLVLLMGLVSYSKSEPQTQSLFYVCGALTCFKIYWLPVCKKIDPKETLRLLSDKSIPILLPFGGNYIESISAPSLCYDIFKDITFLVTFTIFLCEQRNSLPQVCVADQSKAECSHHSYVYESHSFLRVWLLRKTQAIPLTQWVVFLGTHFSLFPSIHTQKITQSVFSIFSKSTSVYSANLRLKILKNKNKQTELCWLCMDHSLLLSADEEKMTAIYIASTL